MSEQQRILEMIEKGQITAAEGMELLEALGTAKEAETVQTSEMQTVTKAKRIYKYLRVKVTSDNKTLNVNVNIPLRLLTTLGEIADKMAAVIPAEARSKMEEKGVDLTRIDFAKIIDEIISGTLEEPDIVDVETWDEESGSMIKVKIYAD